MQLDNKWYIFYLWQLRTDLPQLDMIEESDRSLVLYLNEVTDQLEHRGFISLTFDLLNALHHHHFVLITFWLCNIVLTFLEILPAQFCHLFQIPSDHELCVNVLFEKEFYVGAVQSVPVNVYDYYQPG